jgi:lysozyme
MDIRENRLLIEYLTCATCGQITLARDAGTLDTKPICETCIAVKWQERDEYYYGPKSPSRERTASESSPQPAEERQPKTLDEFLALKQPKTPTINGIDVSAYQGAINWQKVVEEAEITFAYIKATEGQHYVDQKFLLNWENAKAAGLKVGGYHFFHPASDPVVQARHFAEVLKTAGFQKGNLLPMVDLEETSTNPDKDEWPHVHSSQRLLLVETFLKECRLLGLRPIVYTRTNWIDVMLPSVAQPSQFYWLAKYSTTPPVLPAGWVQSGLKLWQYSASGSVPGIQGSVDLDRFLGEDLREISL